MASEMRQRILSAVTASMDVKRKIAEDDELIAKIETVASLCIDAYRKGGRLLLAGNGGSAADAQHIAAELVSRFEVDRPGLAAIALTTDTSMLTAISNDYGYEKVFVRQLEANGRAGDVFIGISTSGKSKNVIAALSRCRELGITAVGLCGSGGEMGGVCDHVLSVPSAHTARIQESHIMIGHIVCELIEVTLFGQGRL